MPKCIGGITWPKHAHARSHRGRPKVVIDKDRLLKNCGFKINEIATFFNAVRGQLKGVYMSTAFIAVVIYIHLLQKMNWT